MECPHCMVCCFWVFALNASSGSSNASMGIFYHVTWEVVLPILVSVTGLAPREMERTWGLCRSLVRPANGPVEAIWRDIAAPRGIC